MKRLIICAAVAAVAAGGMTSCSDFLDVKPVTNKNESDFVSKEGVTQLVTGMYASLNSSDQLDNPFCATLTNYVYGDVMGGDANKGSTYQDQPDFTSLETYSFTTDNGYLEKKWRLNYNSVFKANNVIKVANQCKDELSAVAGQEKDFYTETIAQARFMRGFWHFELLKTFGAAIPFVDDVAMTADVDPKVSNVDESGNYIYIWDKIIEDLQFAYDNLPDIVNDYIIWTAAALMAKVKMYQSSPYNGTNGTSNHWAEVKTILEDVMANGKDNNGTKFRLADTYEELYTAGVSDWTGESVFDVQQAVTGTVEQTANINGAWHTAFNGALGTGGWGFYQPSYDMVNAHIVDANGLPLMDKSYRNQPVLSSLDANNVPHTDLTVYTDPRLDVSAGRFDTPFWDWTIPNQLSGWVRDVGNGGLYLNKKMIPKKADKGSLSNTTQTASTTKNFHVIRYADVLLWYAETLIELGQPQEAGKYINQVRARAANGYVKAADPATMAETTSSYVLDDKVNGKQGANAAANYRIGLYPDSQFSTKDKALEALRWERRIELCMEGHRWFDLVRWGIASDVLNDYLGYEKQYLTKYSTSVYNSKWVTLPIPYNEIIKMDGVLVQNENWK